MAERYGPLLASFVERTDANNTIISSGGLTQLGGIESAEIHKVRGQMNRGRFTLVKTAGWDGLVREGRIVSLYQQNEVGNAAGRGLYREMGSFLVQSVREKVLRDGRQVVEVKGLGLEHLLTKFRHWEAIGKETLYDATLVTNARAPWTTTMDIGAPHGNDSATLTSNTNFLEGDEIRIRMDNGDWYVGHIRNPDPSGPPGTVQMTPRIPYDASAGNEVEGRRARLELSGLTGFSVGQRVLVVLDTNVSWVTVIDTVDLGDSAIAVRDGLPSAAGVGKLVRAYDYSEPAPDDVEQILAPAAGWVVEFDEAGWHGTGRGSSHAPVGESIWDLLIAAAEQNNEYFRIASLSGGFSPRRRLRWLRGADSSGMTLYLRNTNADVAADTENINRGVIRSLERERESDLITRVYPLSGDGRIDLEYCSEEGLLRAAVEGFQVVISTDLFTPDYVQYGAGVAAHGVLEGSIRFGNVSLPKKASLAELNAAADAMLYQAMAAILESQEREYWRAEVHCHRPLYPGQTVQVVNLAMTPTTSNTYYVLEVTERLDRGVIMSSVLLSRQPQLRPTAALKLGRELKAGQQAARRLTILEESAGATVVSGDGGGETGPHEHGEYLRVDGTRALVGNMAAGDGVTFDGVDVSAHAANPAAHHAPVTAADGSIAVTGQAINVASAFAGAGLALAAGVASVNTSTALGTAISGDVVALAADPAGGLEVAAAGARVKRPTDSGLMADATGLYLAPTAVSAITTNSRSGSGHTHQVVATSDGKTNPGQLLKTDSAGDSTLRWLTADQVRTPRIDTATGALTLDPAGGLVNLDGDLTLTKAAPVIRSGTGNSLTLAPATNLLVAPGGGSLELQANTTIRTAHWASGFLGTGWGMTYPGALDCRSITADELIVQTFIADAARVRVGSLWVTPGAALLAEAFTIPAVGATATMIVEDAPGGLANMPVFDAGDWVMVRVVNRAGGGLIVALAWGQVTGYVDGPGTGQQSWTFTTRNTSAPGQVAGGGDEVLGFAKSGSGWIHATTTDAAGAPYLGMTIWRGDNPYTDGNRVHMLRLGQLRGVTGVWEWGLQVGQGTARRLRWSELAAEIHGGRLSLYAGDGAQARVVAADVRLYRDASNYVTLTPNGDGVATNVLSSGSGYFGMIDDAVDSPNAADYVMNGVNTSGQVSVQLTDPSPWGAVYGVTARAVIAGVGFSSDTVRVYAQVVASDEVTPLTGEERLVTLASNVTQTATVQMKPDTAATQAQWNGARLRLRWDYSINSAKEAVRLDPQVPSIGVGLPLPTGATAGGAGFWAGLEGGAYQVRVGNPAGSQMTYNGTALSLRSGTTGAMINLDPAGQSIALGNPLPTGTTTGGSGFWAGLQSGSYMVRIGGVAGVAARLGFDGSTLSLVDSNNVPQIQFDSAGRSYFAGQMTIGAAGGIWQAAAGTWAAPRGGLKIWNASGVGRMATFDSGGATQVEFDSTGALKAGAGIVALDKAGMHVYHAAGGDEVVRLRGQGIEFIDTPNFTDSYGVRFFRNAEEYGQVQGIYFGATERWVRLRTNVPSNQVARTQVHAISGPRTAALNVSATTVATSVDVAADTMTIDAPLVLPKSLRFLPRTTKPTVPTGYAEVYLYQSGTTYQFILRNKNGTEVVLGTVPAA